MNTTELMNEVGVFYSTDERSATVYINHIVLIVEGAWMVIGNGLVTITLLGHKAMQKNRMATMTVLAIPDAFYGIGILSGGLRRVHLILTRSIQLPMSAWECMRQFPTIFYIAGTQMTVLAMVVNSVDRYIAVAHPSYYLAINEKRYIGRLIAFVVGFGVATSALAVASSYWGWGDATTHERLKSALCLSTWAVPSWYATGFTAMAGFGGYASIAIYGLVLRAYGKYMRKTTGALSNQQKVVKGAVYAWLKHHEHPVVARVNNRIDMMTNLNMQTAEDLQIANYGLGGHYDPHFDFARIANYGLGGHYEPHFDMSTKEEKNAFKSLGTGNRIATVLFYKEDIEQFGFHGCYFEWWRNRMATVLFYMQAPEAGGATVFPELKTAVFPTQNDALFWYNLYRDGEGDMRTRHAACPVLSGAKWVANKWVHERGQEVRRPCALRRSINEEFVGDLGQPIDAIVHQ